MDTSSLSGLLTGTKIVPVPYLWAALLSIKLNKSPCKNSMEGSDFQIENIANTYSNSEFFLSTSTRIFLFVSSLSASYLDTALSTVGGSRAPNRSSPQTERSRGSKLRGRTLQTDIFWNQDA